MRPSKAALKWGTAKFLSELFKCKDEMQVGLLQPTMRKMPTNINLTTSVQEKFWKVTA